MNIGIIGAGGAGLYAAMKLLKLGHNIVIYEKMPSFNTNLGVELFVRASSQICFDLIGESLSQDLKSIGEPIDYIIMRDEKGCEQQNIPIKNDLNFKTYCINRGDYIEMLLNKLYRASGFQSTIKWGHKLIDLKQDDNKVRVYFDNEKSYEHDIIIGADGVNSSVRQYINEGLNSNYLGFVFCYGFKEGFFENMPSRSLNMIINKDLYFLSSTFHRKNNKRISWWACISPREEPISKQNVPWDQCITDGKAIIYDSVAKKTPYLKSIIEDTDEFPYVGSFFTIDALDYSYNGRIVLIGDALHAMTAAGGFAGTLAVEDGYVLGKLLEHHKEDYKKAFLDYKQTRVNRVRKFIQYSLDLIPFINHGNNFKGPLPQNKMEECLIKESPQFKDYMKFKGSYPRKSS